MRWVKRKTSSFFQKISPDVWEDKLRKHQLWEKSQGEAGERLQLEGAALAGLNLNGLSLRAASFQGCDFSGVKMEKTDLSACKFWICIFNHVQFSKCKFTAARFNRCHFNHANWQNCSFEGAFFHKATCKQLVARKTDFAKSEVWHSTFEFIAFNQSSFYQATWQQNQIKHADIENCLFVQSHFGEITFEKTRIEECNLYKAAFNCCLYKSFTLRQSDLSYAVFAPFPKLAIHMLSSCVLSGVSIPHQQRKELGKGAWRVLRKPAEVFIGEKRLDHILEAHQLWLDSDGEQGEIADLAYADLRSVDLEKVNLRKANLTKVLLQGANLSGGDIREAMLCDACLIGSKQDGLRAKYVAPLSIMKESQLRQSQRRMEHLAYESPKRSSQKVNKEFQELMKPLEGWFTKEEIAREISGKQPHVKQKKGKRKKKR